MARRWLPAALRPQGQDAGSQLTNTPLNRSRREPGDTRYDLGAIPADFKGPIGREEARLMLVENGQQRSPAAMFLP